METNEIPDIFLTRAALCPGIPGVFLRGKGDSLYLQGESMKNITALIKTILNCRQGFLQIYLGADLA